jgi:hypothetical protein
MHTPLIKFPKLLKSTTADINVKLLTSKAPIRNNNINAIVTTLDMELPPTKPIVVRVAVDVHAVIHNTRDGADCIG